jgi:hypothetical protein
MFKKTNPVNVDANRVLLKNMFFIVLFFDEFTA